MSPISPFNNVPKSFDALFESPKFAGAESDGNSGIINMQRNPSSNISLNVPDFSQSETKSNFSVLEDNAFVYLFETMDLKGLGYIDGQTAVPQFRKSKLEAGVLSKIWQMADINNEGILRLPAFKVAMKLIAMAQNGRPLALSHLGDACPLPVFEGIIIPSSRSSSQSGRGSISRTTPFDQMTNSPFDNLIEVKITFNDALKYFKIFQKASMYQTFLDGNSVRDIMLKSELPVDILKDIWNISDTQGRGQLEAYEFIIAMHYMENIMKDNIKEVPLRLPLELKEAAIQHVKVINQQNNISPPNSNTTLDFRNLKSFSALNSASPYATSLTPQFNNNKFNSMYNTSFTPFIKEESEWNIPKQDLNKYYSFFDNLIDNPNSRIDANTAYQYFIKSKLSNGELAKIWKLADINEQNSLSRDEFAVAMHLIYQRLNGNEIPILLPKDLIPPSLKDKDPFLKDPLPSSIELDLLLSDNKKKDADPTSQSFLNLSEPDLLSFDNNSTINSTNLPDNNRENIKKQVNLIKMEMNNIIKSINEHRPIKTKLENQLNLIQQQKQYIQNLLNNDNDNVLQAIENAQFKIQQIQPSLNQQKENYNELNEHYQSIKQKNELQKLKIEEQLAVSKLAKDYTLGLQPKIQHAQQQWDLKCKQEKDKEQEEDPFMSLVEGKNDKDKQVEQDPFMNLVEDQKDQKEENLKEEDPFVDMVSKQKVESDEQNEDPFLNLVKGDNSSQQQNNEHIQPKKIQDIPAQDLFNELANKDNKLEDNKDNNIINKSVDNDNEDPFLALVGSTPDVKPTEIDIEDPFADNSAKEIPLTTSQQQQQPNQNEEEQAKEADIKDKESLLLNDLDDIHNEQTLLAFFDKYENQFYEININSENVSESTKLKYDLTSWIKDYQPSFEKLEISKQNDTVEKQQQTQLTTKHETQNEFNVKEEDEEDPFNMLVQQSQTKIELNSQLPPLPKENLSLNSTINQYPDAKSPPIDPSLILSPNTAIIQQTLLVDDNKVIELTNMGFSEEQAKDALAKYDNDLDKATNYLLDY